MTNDKRTHQLTTVIITEPGRLQADCNKSIKVPSILFASDVSETGSRKGCPPDSHDILKVCLLPIVDKVRTVSKELNTNQIV